MNDQEILLQIRDGNNSKALNTLYQHFPMVRKLIRSKGGDANDAADIFQEALLILVRKVKQQDFILTSKLSTYLFGVCRFLWQDELRKRKHELPTDWESGWDEIPANELQDTLATEHRATLAERALEDIKERCRELLLYFYQGKMKLKDIAIKMGYSSENVAKNQKYKCLEGAKNRLKVLEQSIQTF